MSDDLTHVVFSGGGFCGLSFIGAIRFLQVEGLDKHIRYVSGTSMGAVFATILALRIPLHDVEKKLTTMLCRDDTLTFPYPDMLTLYKSYGWDDGHKFLAFLRPELDKLTFMDLAKRTGIHLTICATHVESMSATYFSMDTSPNVLVYDALRASIALPWILKPVKIGEDSYIDGGVSDNLPFYPYERANVSPSSILLLMIEALSGSVKSTMASPLTYTCAVLQRFVACTNYVTLLKKTFRHVVLMKDIPVSFIPLQFTDDKIVVSCSEKEVEDTIIKGYAIMYEHFYPKST